MGAPVPIVLSREERNEYERLTRSGKTSVRLKERLTIVLLANRGLNNAEISEQMSISAPKVGRWQNRFAEQGLAGIDKNLPRGGNHGGKDSQKQAQMRQRIIEKTTGEKPSNATHWSARTLAAELGTSHTFVAKVWRELKNSRWCLLKRSENLTEKQEVKLKDLLQYNLRSVRAYLPKEDFNGFWEYVSPAWAGKFLDRWCTRVMRSKVEPMKKVAKTVRKHKPLILNWFRAKKAFSCGVVEGLNNKAKVTTRTSCGFRTYRGAEIALYHALGNLPTPPMTYRFC